MNSSSSPAAGGSGDAPREQEPTFRQGATSVVNLYRTRLELLLLDLEEEKERLEQRLLLSGVAAFLGTAGTLSLTAFFVALLWPKLGPWAIGIFAFLYLGGAAAAIVALRRSNRQRHPTFACTLREFEKDAERFSRILGNRLGSSASENENSP